jgi:hypothetical protein
MSNATITHEVWTVKTRKGTTSREFVVHGWANLHLELEVAAAQDAEYFSIEAGRPSGQVELVIR